MYISAFAKQQNTSVDTLKYYIKIGLLQSSKENNWYLFTQADAEDLKNIMELKDLGLSLEGIQKIKKIHDENCRTKIQWEHNLAVVEDELETTEREIDILLLRKEKLRHTKKQLELKLAE